MKRSLLVLSAVALLASSTAQAGFMAGVIEFKQAHPAPSPGWTHGVPEVRPQQGERKTLIWGGIRSDEVKPGAFVWWAELDHLLTWCK